MLILMAMKRGLSTMKCIKHLESCLDMVKREDRHFKIM